MCIASYGPNRFVEIMMSNMSNLINSSSVSHPMSKMLSPLVNVLFFLICRLKLCFLHAFK